MSRKSVAAAKGRPKSATKKAQIVAAATRLFADMGFEGASMDAIAAKAGVSKQTIYSHFGGKEDLFSQVIREKCVSYELAEEFLDLDRPIEEMLSDVGERFLNLLLSKDALAVHRLMIESGDRHPRLAQLYYEQGPLRMIELVTGFLREHSRRGNFPIADFRTAASIWLHMVKGEAHMCAALHLPGNTKLKNQREHVEHCVSLLLRAYPTK